MGSELKKALRTCNIAIRILLMLSIRCSASALRQLHFSSSLRSFHLSNSFHFPLQQNSYSVAHSPSIMPDLPHDLVIVLAGATAAGKSAAANMLCKAINGEIIIGDSVQIYRHLDIGSNKPSRAEQDSVPHHLVSICDVNDDFSAGDFTRQANACVRDIISRNKVPVIVGGSTMWIQWLMEGIPDNPKRSDDTHKRAEALLSDYRERQAWDEAIEEFKKYNADKIMTLTRNDWYRLWRTLEVALLKAEEDTSIPSASPFVRKSLLSDLNVRGLFLGEDRTSLYRKIDDRCLEMIHQGLLEEVADLLINKGLKRTSMGALAIGYRNTIEYFTRPNFRENDMEAFLSFLNEFASSTRNYAKRQLTWYRKDKNFLWLLSRSSDQVAEELLYWCSIDDDRFREMIRTQHESIEAMKDQGPPKKRNRVAAVAIPATKSPSNLTAHDPGIRSPDNSGMRTYMSHVSPTMKISNELVGLLRRADECSINVRTRLPDF